MAAIVTDMQSGDLFAVNRSNTTYRMNADEIIDPIQTAQDRADAAYAKAEEASGGGGDTIPVGTITWFYKHKNNNPPDGWLICNGGTFSKSAYPELFTQLEYDFGGEGDDFMVPNLQGRFIMGWIGSTRAKGTFQEGTVLSHSHSVNSVITNDENQSHKHGKGTLLTGGSGSHQHEVRFYRGEYERIDPDDPKKEEICGKWEVPGTDEGSIEAYQDRDSETAGTHNHEIAGVTADNTQPHDHTIPDFDTDNTGNAKAYVDNVALIPIIKY